MAPRIVHYGYLLNLKNAMQYVLENHSDYRNLMENYPFVDWRMPVIGQAIEDVRNKSGIYDLVTRFVWLGGGYKGYLWSLPDRFVRRYSELGEPEKLLLHNFRALINERLMPKFYYSCEDSEPEFYKSIKYDEKQLSEYATESMDNLFAAGDERKAAVKMLLETTRKEKLWGYKQSA